MPQYPKIILSSTNCFMSDLQTLFRQYNRQYNALLPDDYVLAAVSGGIDSIVLCHLLRHENYRFGIAHCNFGLRGIESDGDAAFVRTLAEQYQVPYWEVEFPTLSFAEQNKLSIQTAARQLRYEWLEKTRYENQFTCIATAHHRNDLLETMLYNLTMGTGIAGLHGIRSRHNKIVRPLLFSTKAALLDFAKNQELPYREDSSNQTVKYARNKIRHQVVPILKELNPSLEQTFFDNAMRFEEVEHIYLAGIERYRKALCKTLRQETLISIGRLKKIVAKQSVLFELLKAYHYNNDQVKQILAALDGDSGKVFYSDTHQLLKDRKYLILSKRGERDISYFMLHRQTEKIEQSGFVLTAKFIPREALSTLPTDQNTACLDTARLTFPLTLRRFKQGDYFYPLGMGMKKKKVSRYFIDKKLNKHEKERAWILSDDEKHIAWVVGHRIDERHKVNDKTTEILLLEYRPT